MINSVFSGAFTVFSLLLWCFFLCPWRHVHARVHKLLHTWLHIFADVMFTFGDATEQRVHAASLPLLRHHLSQAGENVQVSWSE